MAPTVSRERVVAGLRAVWASIDELASALSDEQWRLPSPLPGWDVHANIAHVMGTEAFLLGIQPRTVVDADSLGHVRNPIGAMNENWIASYADASPPEVLATFRELTARRLELLGAMAPEEWGAVGFTPAGEGPYGRFMQIRVFDSWMHEQDIRAAVGVPGHDAGVAVEVSLDEMTTAMGFVVGKRAGAPPGSSVTFDLTGPTSRRIHVVVGERATVVPGIDGPATVTITLPVVSFSRIAGGRLDADEHRTAAVLDGDEELGASILGNLSYTV